MVDFKADLRETAIATLEAHHVRYKKSDSLHTLLVRLYTFWGKYISPQKRNVLISKELSENLATYPQSVQSAFRKMVEWTEAGIDINCFQSRGLYGQGARDYQNMIYGVVHLHLSAKKEDKRPIIKKDGFAKPGQYLLFAHFDNANAYFIKILEHPQALGTDGNIATEWISKDILYIMEHNWPGLLADRKINGMSLCDSEGNPIELDDKAIATLTSNHINTFFRADSSLYAPEGGIVGSGDSMKAIMSADRALRDVMLAQKFYENNMMKLCTMLEKVLEKCGIQISANFDIHYDYIDELDQFMIVDRNSGVVYDYGQNKSYLLLKYKS